MTSKGDIPHIRPQETIDRSFRLTDAGLTDRENAAACGVAIKTIRRWRRLYRRRGLRRGQSNASATCPRCDGSALNESAYAQLLGWYLGDGHIAKCAKGVYSLRIYNDQRYTDLNVEIARILTTAKGTGRASHRQRDGCIETKLDWKHWPCLFPQHGPGRKHERPIVLADWQREIVERYPGKFLRGLFHSDGYRGPNPIYRMVSGEKKRYEYMRYFFTNASDDIRGLCCWALDLLGIPWRRTNARNIAVSRREAVAELDKYVGPKF